MKVLTVRQPYPYPIGTGAKGAENRSRPTNHRGPLAIHAAAMWARDADDDPFVRALLGDQLADRRRFVRGAVVVVVDLVGCHRSAGCCADIGGRPDPWHWELTRPVPLPRPVPARGRLGLWDIDDRLLGERGR